MVGSSDDRGSVRLLWLVALVALAGCSGAPVAANPGDSPGDGPGASGDAEPGPGAGCPLAPGLPVFPGAEGAGTTTPAGRGGAVLEVTSLADSGPGSLRDALTQPFPRIIVFRVGGTITLAGEVYVNEPYVTVAGQTAPGDGILLRDAGLVITTHDVLIQHLRVRPGDTGPVNPDTNDAIGILGPKDTTADAHHVVLDHVSATWSEDEALQLWAGTHDVTISWSIVGEALNYARHSKIHHSAGLLIGDESNCISVHHNLMIHSDFRSPLIIKSGLVDLRDNLVFDWGILAAEVEDIEAPGVAGGNVYLNFVNNVYTPGPASAPDSSELKINWGSGTPRIFRAGNVTPRLDAAIAAAGSDPRLAVVFVTTPFVFPAVTDAPTGDLGAAVAAGVGAYPTRRDAVDARLVSDFGAGTGGLIDSPVDVGGYPVIAGGAAPADGDHDGMPDAWEQAHGLDPVNPADGPLDRDGDGYTNVEEYLNSLL